MAQFPDAFGMSVTVEDMDAARRFYTELYQHDTVLDGVFAGINYLSVMRDGETLVNIFQKGEGNPLAAIFPKLKVDSVAAYEEKVKALGGSVLIPASLCPYTSSPFAVCARFRGTHAGDLMGIAPTGKQVALPFIIVYQVAGGKIAGFTMAIDQMDLMKQLGVVQ